MVVAEVIRIRNNTMRTFQVEAGDPFYTPQVDGRPCVDGRIEVAPGFDQAVEGLVVPWEKMTSGGLMIKEVIAESAKAAAAGTAATITTNDEVEKAGPVLRCVVGPIEADGCNFDWLRFHGDEWEPLAQERWTPLGRRHYLGAVGGSVEIQLTFRDARSQSFGGPAELVEVTHFERAVACAPQNAVFLNVFDLASALSIPNAMLCNTMMKSIGAFHAAVEVYSEEWSFYRTPNPHSCGVCKSLRPRHHPVHVYRQSVNLGQTSLKDWEVRYLIRARLAPKWLGGGYDLLHHNCIHFCDELLLALGVKSVPPWVKGLHETGASVFRMPWPLSLIWGSDDEASTPALTNGTDGGDSDRDEGNSTAESPAGTTSAVDGAGPGDPPPDANFMILDRTESGAVVGRMKSSFSASSGGN
mmetsp:Transcript_85457/g.160979  ORF Transcript_85457/g.160979 Transcript_85457/m.160979 type:complete len:413 (+) Transcript_85457:107-1345(+)